MRIWTWPLTLICDLYTWREKMSHPRGYVTITRVSTSVPEQSQEKSGAGRQLLPGAAIVQQVR